MVDAGMSDQEKMKKFWRKGDPPAIGNAEVVELQMVGGMWRGTAGNRVKPPP